MANIASFEVNGVSYSYDTESRNPLSNKVKTKALAGELVYDANTKSPTEVVGIPANSLKDNAANSGGSANKPEKPIHTATLYYVPSSYAASFEITYTGSLNNIKSLTLVGAYDNGCSTKQCELGLYYADGCSDSSEVYQKYLTYTGSDYTYEGLKANALVDEYNDEGFEIVSHPETFTYSPFTATLDHIDVVLK